jgi:isoquinoline 1-oxidoreductase alpha subunit
MVMAAAALLARNSDPSAEDIATAIPVLCRCGVYPRVVRAVQRAGRVLRREETISAAPAPGIRPEDAARAVPAMERD